jgi:hypothetical protein
MNEPARSEALKRALGEEDDGLPEDFAGRVAALAEGDGAARNWGWTDVALVGAFAAMISVCVAGWFEFGAQELGGNGWFDLSVGDLALQPWLVTGVAGLTLVQLLTFRRRVTNS